MGQAKHPNGIQVLKGPNKSFPFTEINVKMLSGSCLNQLLPLKYHENQHKTLPGIVIILKPPDKVDFFGMNE